MVIRVFLISKIAPVLFFNKFCPVPKIMIVLQNVIDIMVLDKYDTELDTIKTVLLLEKLIKRKLLDNVTQLFFSIDLQQFQSSAVEYRRCMQVSQDLRQLGFKVFSKDLHTARKQKIIKDGFSLANFFGLVGKLYFREKFKFS